MKQMWTFGLSEGAGGGSFSEKKMSQFVSLALSSLILLYKNLLTTESYMPKFFLMVLFEQMHWPLSPIRMKLEVYWVTERGRKVSVVVVGVETHFSVLLWLKPGP
jgi:hypothetical protein